MKAAPQISDNEWDVMNTVWERAPVTADQVIARLREADPSWHFRTVKTYLGRLVKKQALAFRSVDGVPAALSVIYFCTRGAGGAVEKKLVRPVVVAAVPANGAKDVDPALRELRVSFNVPMGPGCSWLLAGGSVPSTPDGAEPYWTDDRRTCVVPVELEPGKEYRMSLNGAWHNNFQSAAGVPLEPVLYTFHTRN